MSYELRRTIIEDLKYQEQELNYPTFTWQGSTYNFIPSISEFKRDLDRGGYEIVKLLTATVRKYDFNEDIESDYNGEDISNCFISLYPNGYPTAQNIIMYSMDNANYRIEVVKNDPTNAYMRITAVSTTRGLAGGV